MFLYVYVIYTDTYIGKNVVRTEEKINLKLSSKLCLCVQVYICVIVSLCIYIYIYIGMCIYVFINAIYMFVSM